MVDDVLFVACLAVTGIKDSQCPQKAVAIYQSKRHNISKRLETFITVFFYVLLTVHLSIILADDQLDAQFLYFIIRLLQSSTCFEQRRAYHQEVKLY